MTLSQAVDRYLQEPPPLPRLRTNTRPPIGYARHGPKDVLETIAEYLQVEAPEAQEQQVQTSTSSKAAQNQEADSGPLQLAVPTASMKARQNQEALDEAVYVYSDD